MRFNSKTYTMFYPLLELHKKVISLVSGGIYTGHNPILQSENPKLYWLFIVFGSILIVYSVISYFIHRNDIKYNLTSDSTLTCRC